jgi:hypothetical protein
MPNDTTHAGMQMQLSCMASKRTTTRGSELTTRVALGESFMSGCLVQDLYVQIYKTATTTRLETAWNIFCTVIAKLKRGQI